MGPYSANQRKRTAEFTCSMALVHLEIFLLIDVDALRFARPARHFHPRDQANCFWSSWRVSPRSNRSEQIPSQLKVRGIDELARQRLELTLCGKNWMKGSNCIWSIFLNLILEICERKIADTTRLKRIEKVHLSEIMSEFYLVFFLPNISRRPSMRIIDTVNYRAVGQYMSNVFLCS